MTAVSSNAFVRAITPKLHYSPILYQIWNERFNINEMTLMSNRLYNGGDLVTAARRLA